MVVCKFFAQGWCKFGKNCRFEHVDPGRSNNRDWQERDSTKYSNNNNQNYRYQYGNNRYNDNRSHGQFGGNKRVDQDKENVQSVIHDIECWEYGGQWLFTCYLPMKDGENFPGFNDISPEEFRWKAYQAEKSGTFDKYKQEVAEMIVDVNNKRQKLKSVSPPILDILNKIFNGVKLDPSISASGNLFGSTSSSPVDSFSFKLPTTSNAISNQNAFSNNSQPFPHSAGNFGSNVNPPLSFGSGSSQGQSMFGGNETTTSNTFFTSNSFPSTQPSQMNTFIQPQTQGNLFQTQTANDASTFSFVSKTPNVTSTTTPTKEQTLSQGFSFVSNQSNLFGGKGSQSIVDEQSSKYSSMDNLTEEEKKEFVATIFTQGLIPEKPPPKQLCS